jgi:amidase
VKRGNDLPAFHGVPTGIKDLHLVRWTRAGMGSRGSMPLISPVDDELTASVRRGGFVIVGKTTTSEIGAMPVTEPDTHAPTRNPWNTAHSSGGSSGGAAAAVAARMLPIAPGSDGGGSIRGPSSFCHLFGVKPSRGRVPNAYRRDDQEILYTSGPIARSVEDAAALLDVLAGFDVGRPHWAPVPERSYRQSLKVAPPKRLKIRVGTNAPLGSTDPEIVSAVEGAAKVLADLGHDVDTAMLPTCTLEEFLPIWQALVADVPMMRWSLAQPITQWLVEGAKSLRPGLARERRRELEARFLAVFDQADLWVTPTTPISAPLVGAFANRPPAEAFTDAARIGGFTAAFNVTGQPASNVPLGLDSKGMPMGLQLAGRKFEDDVVLAVSRQLEVAMPWHTRTAPIE